MNAFYGDKLITSVLLDKIRNGAHGFRPKTKAEASNFLAACIKNATFAKLAPEILPNAKITKEEWLAHDHCAGTAVEAAICCVADLSNESLKQAEKDIAINAVANLILEAGIEYLETDWKPSRAKFNDLGTFFKMEVSKSSLPGPRSHDRGNYAIAKVIGRKVWTEDKKIYTLEKLPYGGIICHGTDKNRAQAAEEACRLAIEELKSLGLVDEFGKGFWSEDRNAVEKAFRDRERKKRKQREEEEIEQKEEN